MANIDITNRQGVVVVSVADNQINEPSPVGVTSISVLGRNVLDYGDEIGNNFHWLMENFANSTSPEGPVNGQLWWDISSPLNPVLRVYNAVIDEFVSTIKLIDDANPELSANLNAGGNNIVNLLNPINDQDAATKLYVDTEITSSLGILSNTFITLTDTPSTFLGQANKIVKVNSAQDSLIFDTINFLELNDTPGLFLGAANQVVRVNSAANALEFKQLALTDLISTGALNMAGFRIEALGDPNTSDDAMSLGFADNRYLRDTSGNTNGIPIRISSTGETISRSIAAGSGITVSNGSGVSGNPTVSHADTSSQNSVNNSGSVVIQDITLDAFGHVTGIASTSLAIPSTSFNDDRYLRDSAGNVNGFVVRTSSTGETTARTLQAGSNITISNADGVSGNPTISAVIPPAIPAGSIIQFAGVSAPSGWLLCNGASVSRTTFADLFSTIGTLYGSTSGTTFNVPNMGGRFPLGVNGSHALGTTGGEETHTLTVSEMPSHTHSLANKKGDGGGFGNRIDMTDEADRGTLFTNSTGGNAAHNNMPPFISLNNIIKT